MTGRTFGVPAALEEYTRVTVPTLLALRLEVDELAATMAALATAPSDLDAPVVDRSAEWHAWADRLRAADEVPAAFAFALRALDGAPFGDEADDLAWLEATDAAATAVAAAWLQRPYATADAVLGAGSGGVCRPLPTRPEASLQPGYWSEIITGNLIAGSTAEALDLAHVEVGSSPPRWLLPLLRGSGIGGLGLEAAAQLDVDLADPNVTPGRALANAFARTLLEGGGGVVGATAGAVAGAALGPAGVVFFGASLGLLGAEAGRMMREHEVTDAGLEAIGAALDELMNTAHDDDYDHTLLGGGR